MKLVLLLLCLLYVTFSKGKDIQEEIKEIKQKAHEHCVQKTGASEELIQQEIQNNVYTQNENLKCYEACKYVYFGLVDEKTGKFSLDKFQKNYPKEFTSVWSKILTDCNVTDFGKNMCEEAWQYLTTCFVNQPDFAPF
ncbi:unnamed protein product [Brassicogethes aeneus]|uniref:Uncharacterized protein n=1 Tax=Brassicogethes aeneus TaxID=1431903 RepID=A0A9P0FKB8_BRAAE|nr:unnamed protein product [Brassicogethes aeneus]